jgi:hypothetical protein
MSVKIETYRGHDIMFSPEHERFSFSLDGGNYTEKQTYSACKKNIDDFVKGLQNFKPFDVINVYTGKIITIVSIRKDGRFIYKEVDSDKIEQLSDYCNKEYIIYDESISETVEQMKVLENQQEKLSNEIDILSNKHTDLAKSLTGKSLVTFKNEILIN